MSAVRCPRIAELRSSFMFGGFLADVFDICGITDDDLPDIIRDDADYTDADQIRQAFPKLVEKVEKAWPR
jgi:hypothetical protein